VNIRDLVESILGVYHSNINIVAYVEYFTEKRIYLKKCKNAKKNNLPERNKQI
jgi:hypothetical protein